MSSAEQLLQGFCGLEVPHDDVERDALAHVLASAVTASFDEETVAELRSVSLATIDATLAALSSPERMRFLADVMKILVSEFRHD